MTPLDLITARRVHLDRLANQRGALGETDARLLNSDWIPRPRGALLKALLDALVRDGKPIKASAFDAIALPSDINELSSATISTHLSALTFVEIKTANQARVRPGFAGFFFALTENEIEAAKVLGAQHRVALFNKLSGELLLTNVAELVARARSSTWQISLQL